MTTNSNLDDNFPAEVILQNLLDAVLIVDTHGIIVYANPSAETLFSKTNQELLSENFGYPVKPYEIQEIQVLRSNKIRIIQMLASTVVWKKQEGFVLALRDITLHKDAEDELILKNKNLELANIENEQYAHLAAHDLREPLRKISIYSDLLLTQDRFEDINGDARDKLNKIHSCASRMKELISGISALSLVKNQKPNFQSTNLQEIIENVCCDLEISIREKNVELSTDPLPVINAISIQVYKLFLNIISNSIKYAKEIEPPKIIVTLEKETDQLIEICFTDNGIGFDNRYANLVFNPFARLNPKYCQGSGIGLTICKKIIDAHGGKISIESEAGIGTKIKVLLLKNPV